MFRKVLIANRGEIACRIIRTLRRMGIASVAVYSDADRYALHVLQADEAVHLGPSPVIESYLCEDKHIAREIAGRAGAPLLPGSGLLADLGDARSEAHRIGYPIMLKSSAGGGGIGMRLVEHESELA